MSISVHFHLPLLIGLLDGLVSFLLAVLIGDVLLLLHMPEPKNAFLHKTLFDSDVGEETST